MSNQTIRILATSDVHGYIYPYNYSDNKIANLGLSRLASIVDQYRNENTILIDNGDCLQGSPLCFYYNNLKKDETHIITRVMNRMNYDYINLGNHDFNMGARVLKRYIEESNAACICENVKIDGKKAGHYVLHHFKNGKTAAIFGMVTQRLLNWEKPDNLIGIELEDAYECAQRVLKEIKEKEKVDLIICAYHGGFEKDLKTGKPTEVLNGENRGYDICQNLDDIDILITGHQHRSIAGKLFNKVISQTAFNAKEIACIDYDVEKKEGQAKLLPSTATPRQDLLDEIKLENEECQKWLDTPLGHCDQDLIIHDGFQARLNKHPLVSFLNEVQFSLYPDANFSATALFNDAKGFNHDITMRDVVSTYVYSNTLVAMGLSKKTLKEYLELCAEYFEIENDQIVVSPRFLAPKPAHFNYDMVDGLNYTIKVSNPIHHRIIDMNIDGKPLDENKEYILLVSNYRSTGGGDFDMLKDARIIKDTQIDMVEAIGNYILKNPDIHFTHHSNITIIK